MRRFHLAVSHACPEPVLSLSKWPGRRAELPAFKLPGEMRQRDLRSVADPAEHGFTVEHAPDADTVQSPHEFVFHPYFHRMRIAQLMQRAICSDHVLAYPGASMMPGSWCGAGAHHCLESGSPTHRTGPFRERGGDWTGTSQFSRDQHH